MIRSHALNAPRNQLLIEDRPVRHKPIPYDPVRNYMERGKGARLGVGHTTVL